MQQKFYAGGGTTTNLSKDEKIDANLYYENTIFNKQNGSAGTGVQLNTGYVNQTTENPYSTIGGAVQYTKNMNGIIHDIILNSMVG